MAENRFIVFKCKKCSTMAYPKRFLCTSCKGRDFEEYPLNEPARVVTYTHLWAVPEGIDRLPLTLAIAEFPDHLRVTGQITTGEIKTGDRVRPVWGQIREIRGRQIEGFRFDRLS